jgi:hypothetical protein
MMEGFVPRSCGPLGVVLLAASGVLGCSQKDAEKCSQGLQVTRQAVAAENFAAAGQWREYAYKQCEDTGSLEGLDREITAAQAQVQAREAATQQRRQQTRELLKVFLGFVAGHRASADRASEAPSCDPPAPDDPKRDESKDRFCVATRAAGTHPLLVRYWAAEPAVARFSVNLPDATSCEEIGASNVVKTWAVAAVGGKTTPRTRCEFTSGPLAGMHAVLSQAVNADLYVFNPAYLDREPTLKPILEGP